MQAADGKKAERPLLHAAIIMDGNGRWAKRRGLPRTAGHKFGVDALKRTVRGAVGAGVGTLTVFGFSTENWSRPGAEVSELMKLLKAYVASDLESLASEGVRVEILGRRDGLEPDIRQVIERAEARTAANDAFVLQVAFNYGGQADIADAARHLARQVAEGKLSPDDINEGRFAQALSTRGSAPDLIIRTSGEHRISNFLLWEAAYAEFIFQDVLWPDYGPEHLKAAVDEFHGRERRFGGVEAKVAHVAG